MIIILRIYLQNNINLLKFYFSLKKNFEIFSLKDAVLPCDHFKNKK